MKMSIRSNKFTAGAIGLLVAGSVLTLTANGVRFSDFTPLAASAGPTANEATPITFGNPYLVQRSIADRNTQLLLGIPNSGDWDMNTVNETGPHKGRYLFTVFETGASGVQRHDLQTGRTDTIWHVLPGETAARFDPTTWTPWGTVITGEENWGCSGPAYECGRLFELRNPIDAPAIYLPLGAFSNAGADFVHINIIPRVSHEGLQFDRDNNLYYVDELNGGCVYKYTTAASWGEIMSGRAGYFDAGTVYALRVGTGFTPNATGAFTWVALTDAAGTPLPGTVTVTDSNNLTSLDGRATGNLPAFRCTDYQRPEDAQIQAKNSGDILYFTATTTNEVYRLDLEKNMATVFADRSTIDLATGQPVGGALASPDNLALDLDGNIYIIEDRNGGVDDDIWFAKDLNGDGDLHDRGEGLGRWASNGTPGSEFSGLYFDPTDKRRAWVNIQHPNSDNDRTIEITIP